MTTYQEILESKKKRIQDAGFDVQPEQLNPALFDFQRHIVKTALKKGRYAIFADCGLGKTLMQLEWARHITMHTNGPVLILCPLAVAGQTIKEGVKFGIDVQRLRSDVFGPGIFITNYEQLDNIDCTQFSGIV
jgi:superfamily II DNA or RNA helicase